MKVEDLKPGYLFCLRYWDEVQLIYFTSFSVSSYSRYPLKINGIDFFTLEKIHFVTNDSTFERDASFNFKLKPGEYYTDDYGKRYEQKQTNT